MTFLFSLTQLIGKVSFSQKLSDIQQSDENYY